MRFNLPTIFFLATSFCTTQAAPVDKDALVLRYANTPVLVADISSSKHTVYKRAALGILSSHGSNKPVNRATEEEEQARRSGAPSPEPIPQNPTPPSSPRESS